MTDMELVFVGLRAHVEQAAEALGDPEVPDAEKARIKLELRRLYEQLVAVQNESDQ